eukprot:CAMPEP_0182447140 /NCGR_PEP_ID=MMETSP1172-20130603/11968_1 /TAXON_ID=708627 /ORGANISM="Timspurckia oligopyrenoides, Strain CCMP3278" /LENGTH=192 /DNA_ID=CAMNT_0024643457 /DNA_START=55 /DNA_END=633 /DNA_ORIENTATION=-
MVEILTESSSFFTLKELEKIAPKKKGIIFQSVKEVVQSLVDDDLIGTDKCGVQTVYWCLPSDNVQKKRARIRTLEKSIENKNQMIANAKEENAALQKGRESSETRDQLLRKLSELTKTRKELEEKLSRFAECDTDLANAMKDGTTVAVEAANRWTDNIFTLKSWTCNTFGLSPKDFEESFCIPAELDYIESM